MTVSVSNHPIAMDSSDDEDDDDARRHVVHMAICAEHDDANTPVDACRTPTGLTHTSLLKKLNFLVSMQLLSLVLSICAMAVCAVPVLAQAGMIGFITLQQSAPSQMTWQDSNAFGEH